MQPAMWDLDLGAVVGAWVARLGLWGAVCAAGLVLGALLLLAAVLVRAMVHGARRRKEREDGEQGPRHGPME
jgi:heme A synthase